MDSSGSALVATKGFGRILVAVDGSEVSMRAAGRAAHIAKEEGADVIVLHVVPTPPFEVPIDVAEYHDAGRKQARKWMKEIEDTMTKEGVKAKTEIVVGAYSIVDAIVGYAETCGVGLIVTGTRGRTPSNRFRLGSVASGLAESAGCPVLVVR